MKPNKTLFIVILLAFTLIGAACSASSEDESKVIGMANPASVYCIEQGGELEIRTGKDGGQYGVCIFDDGSECDEWAFYQDHCSPGEIFPVEDMAEPIVEEDSFSGQVTALCGAVVSPSAKGPSDSQLVHTSEGFPAIFLTGETAEIETMIRELKDKSVPANKANFWGRLECSSADQCLLSVTRMRVDGPGDEMPGDKVEAWEGVIYSGPSSPRSGGDDYFALLGTFPFEYGIWSMDEALNQQLEELRDSGQAVRIWGELHAGRPDWNATQIVVTQIELIEVDASLIPPTPSW